MTRRAILKPRTVVFDRTATIVILPDLLWTGVIPLATVVAQHVTMHGRLKRGEWFVHTDTEQRGGHLFFRGRSAVVTFTVRDRNAA